MTPKLTKKELKARDERIKKYLEKGYSIKTICDLVGIKYPIFLGKGYRVRAKGKKENES